jgi:hypothetical protein
MTTNVRSHQVRLRLIHRLQEVRRQLNELLYHASLIN